MKTLAELKCLLAPAPVASAYRGVYRFRAECAHDVEVLRGVLQTRGVAYTMPQSELSPHWPDVVCTIETNLPLKWLRRYMRDVPDGHVMRQTLSPLATYTGQRDYSHD